jgi:hypothetical protein
MDRYSYADYRQAASVLWGAAGRFAIDEQERLNRRYFAAALPPLPVVIGITAYGRCLGLTRGPEHLTWRTRVPRITLASNLFAEGSARVSDLLLHEMVHAKLILAGLAWQHNSRPWCEEIMRLSPLVADRAILAAPVHPRRIKGQSVRQARDGYLSRAELARWPAVLRGARPPRGEVLPVPTY